MFFDLAGKKIRFLKGSGFSDYGFETLTLVYITSTGTYLCVADNTGAVDECGFTKSQASQLFWHFNQVTKKCFMPSPPFLLLGSLAWPS
jgi:hypothetical protein